jgi:hypothetical protein
MARSHRSRKRKRGRRAAFRDPKPIILIVCEGANTEPQYLRGFVNSWRNPRVTIRIAPEHGDPKYLVEAAKQHKADANADAKRQRDDNLSYDAVWCVCDVDDHRRLAEARQMARDNGIDLAVSNPCFELWLLLHFQTSPGMQDRVRLLQMLRKHVPDYDKEVDYSHFQSGYEQAVARATRMDRAAANAGEPGRNPTTGVYRLTELIREE